jgi:hypothetical protein
MGVFYHFGSFGLLLFPAGEVYVAGERRHHDELGEGNSGFEGHFYGGIEGSGLVCREAEDEGAKNMHAVLFECLELSGKGFAGVVEVLERLP